MAELADAPDSKSGSPQGECGFDPLFRHHPSLRSVWLPDERLRHAAPALRAGASGLAPLVPVASLTAVGLGAGRAGSGTPRLRRYECETTNQTDTTRPVKPGPTWPNLAQPDPT
jgi:hypothetical protein